MSSFFTVVIPFYNRGDFAIAALASVTNQTETDFEVLLVDDGSDESTREAVLLAVANEPRARVLHQENAGQNVARNLAIQQAAGQYVAFLDSDDLMTPNTLAIYRRVIESTDAPSLVYGATVTTFRDEADIEHLMRRNDRPDLDHMLHPSYFEMTEPALVLQSCSGVVVRLDVLRKHSGFEPLRINGMDVDFWLRLGAEPGFVTVRSPITWMWRAHDQPRVTGNGERHVKGVIFLLDRELAAGYPGGARLARQRRAILTRVTRPSSLHCLNRGWRAASWSIYNRTFVWNARQFRLKYLLAFPVLFLASLVKPKPKTWTSRG
ncbi:MAG: glycosyltransferase family 2 protein [Planctomycetota bacterium]